MTSLQEDAHHKYVELFGDKPLIIRSPGRINFIGEHTDYNDGFVMPAAIDKEAVFAIGASRNGKSTVHALKFEEQFEVDLNNPVRVESPTWANFLLGVLFQFKQKGYALKPFHCVFGGDVPLGAGLSSSAAIECGFGFALSALNNLNVPRMEIIKIGQWAEHNYVGVKCGIMDQFASVMGKADHAIVLDCRSLTHRYAPLNMSNHAIVLCDSKVKHSLVDSEYNKRRAECEEGVDIVRSEYPQVKSLRDVTPEMLEKFRAKMTPTVFKRCSYVVGEIQRVQLAVMDLERGDLRAFGQKMYETHEGLSKLYEVSTPELDFLVQEARKHPEVLGARVMGGGFGGCTINLVEKSFVDTFNNEMKNAYRRKYNIDMPTYVVAIEDGTSVVSADVGVVGR